MIVILNEVKNLMNSNESTIEILRLSPQNDIATQPPEREGNHYLPASSEEGITIFLPFQGGGQEGDGDLLDVSFQL
jgi:hypothetical protein